MMEIGIVTAVAISRRNLDEAALIEAASFNFIADFEM